MASRGKGKSLKDAVKAGPDKIADVAKKARRGRTNISPDAVMDPADKIKNRPTRPMLENTQRAESNRPVSSGPARHRGDRRDTNPTYTGNQKHSARGNTPRTSAKTRKR